MGSRSYYICNLCKMIGSWVWLAYHIIFGQIRRELICMISLLLRFTFSRPDAKLV